MLVVLLQVVRAWVWRAKNHSFEKRQDFFDKRILPTAEKNLHRIDKILLLQKKSGEGEKERKDFLMKREQAMREMVVRVLQGKS